MDKSWIRNKLLDLRINQKKLASMLDLDAGSVSRLISGERKLQLGEAASLSLIFDEPLDEILVRFGIVTDSNRVNLKLSGFIDEDGELQKINEPISIVPPQSAIGKLDCVQIRGDSVLDRSIVFFGDPVSVVTDRLALHLLEKDRVVMGIASKGYLPKTYKIKTISGNEIQDVAILSCRVIADITPL